MSGWSHRVGLCGRPTQVFPVVVGDWFGFPFVLILLVSPVSRSLFIVIWFGPTTCR